MNDSAENEVLIEHTNQPGNLYSILFNRDGSITATHISSQNSGVLKYGLHSKAFNHFSFTRSAKTYTTGD